MLLEKSNDSCIRFQETKYDRIPSRIFYYELRPQQPKRVKGVALNLPYLKTERNCYASSDDEYPTHDFVNTKTR
jgi:hypothetical protein